MNGTSKHRFADDRPKNSVPHGRPARRACRKEIGKRQDGFTLIELLASSVLTVLLTTALLTVLNSSIQETRQLRADQSRYPSIGLLREQIRRDVYNAQGMQPGANLLVLYGFLATDPLTRMPTLQQAIVTYRLSQRAGDVVLIREEQPIGGLTPAPGRRDVVWKGVHRFDVRGIGGVAVDDSDLGMAADTGGLPAVPRTLRVVVLDDSQQVLMRETILHHQEN